MRPSGLSPGVRRLLLTCAVVLLIALAWGALAGGVRQIPRADTIGQQAETVVQLACGLLALLVVLTSFRWRRWGPVIRAAWVASAVITVGLSSLVWGPPMPLVGLLFAAAALLAALAITWALRTALPPSGGPGVA